MFRPRLEFRRCSFLAENTSGTKTVLCGDFIVTKPIVVLLMFSKAHITDLLMEWEWPFVIQIPLKTTFITFQNTVQNVCFAISMGAFLLIEDDRVLYHNY